MLGFNSEERKKLMSESVDARCERFNIKLKVTVYLSLILFVTVLVVAVFWEYPDEMRKALLYYYIIFSVSYIPLILFSVFGLRNIVNSSDEYVFFEAVLDDFGVSLGRYYFIVSFRGVKGERYTGKTSALYREYSSSLCFGDWQGEKVLAAYSRLNGRVFVIRKL